MQGSNGETDIENRLIDMGRGKGRVRRMERVTWKLILPYVKLITKGNLLYVSRNSNRGSVTIQKGGLADGEGDGREGGDRRVPVADS